MKEMKWHHMFILRMVYNNNVVIIKHTNVK
jgi:hypothetical protein